MNNNFYQEEHAWLKSFMRQFLKTTFSDEELYNKKNTITYQKQQDKLI